MPITVHGVGETQKRLTVTVQRGKFQKKQLWEGKPGRPAFGNVLSMPSPEGTKMC